MKSGIILLDKSIGMTSREADNRVGRLFSTRKVGHLGTLDPFASGLLLIALNGGTKFLPYLDDEEKTYEASLLLGEKSSTGDKEGEIIERKEVPFLKESAIKEALLSFLGESLQLPPMYSAIKINGTPLYKLAHKGEEIERKKRIIKVHSIELLSIKEHTISFRCTVSKGTYIRVLGEDIASKLGTVGHLTSLRRTSVGAISVDKAVHLDEIEESSIVDPTPFLTSFPHLEVDMGTSKMAKDGRKLFLGGEYGEKLLLTHGGTALAIYTRIEGGFYKAERGLFL